MVNKSKQKNRGIVVSQKRRFFRNVWLFQQWCRCMSTYSSRSSILANDSYCEAGVGPPAGVPHTLVRRAAAKLLWVFVMRCLVVFVVRCLGLFVVHIAAV